MPAGLGGRPVSLPSAGWVDPIDRPQRWIGRAVRFNRLDRLTQLALVASHRAVQGYGLPRDRTRAGIVLGTAFGSHLTNEAFQIQLEQLGAAEASPALFTHTLPSSAVGAISIQFGLQGPTVTLTEGIGAGVAAVALAAQMVAQGEADWMLAGAADTLSPTLLAAAGAEAGRLAEGAAFFVVVPGAAGAVARIAAADQGRVGEAEVEQAVLDKAGLVRGQIQTRLVYLADGDYARQERHGRSLSAAPLLGATDLLQHHGETLPALITVRDHQGTTDVVCLTSP